MTTTPPTRTAPLALGSGTYRVALLARALLPATTRAPSAPAALEVLSIAGPDGRPVALDALVARELAAPGGLGCEARVLAALDEALCALGGCT